MSQQPPVSFRINGERLVVLGWSRAILLQLAHPLIAAAVFDHSGFRASPLAAVQRLHHTTRAMLALTFGDAARRDRALDGIRTIHARVNGTLREPVGPYPAGTPYSAEDPALLLWVHATLIDSMVLTYDQLIAPLTDAERDEYCADAAPSSIALGVRAGDVPRTWRDLRDYLQATYASGDVVVGPQARDLAEALQRTSIPRPLAVAGAISRTLTGGFLPPPIRDAYAIAWSAARERRYQRLVRTLRRVRPLLPEVVALWPDARAARSQAFVNP